MADALRPGDWVHVNDHIAPAWIGRVSVLRSQWVTVKGDDGREERVRWRHITPTSRPTPHPGRATQPANRELGETVAQPKAMPLRDKPYLEWVRKRPCIFCGVKGRTGVLVGWAMCTRMWRKAMAKDDPCWRCYGSGVEGAR